jgi:pyruvate dehydrogenase E2 component (dihydrolipoamide acetyltransferase)
MAESFQTIPHFYLTVEVGADNLTALRETLRHSVEADEGTRLSFTDLFVRCVALTLRKHPLVNACWQNQEIRWNPDINIGIAVATPEGLVVPVIHRADTLTVAQIAKKRMRLEVEAKEQRLALHSVQGATFTITNLGPFGIDAFSPIINPPQAAILAIGRIARRAVERQGALSLAPTVYLTLAVDHRILDGAEAAAFLGDLRAQIEHGQI